MIKIYARSTKIGQKAYSAVVEGLDLHGRIFTEEVYGADGFTENLIELDSPRTASFILDGHYGSGNADLYVHAAEKGRMPSGLVRTAFNADSVLLETNHGESVGNKKEILNEAYVVVRKTDDVNGIVKLINDFLDAEEPPENREFYTAIKNGGRHIKKEMFEVPAKPTYIIAEGARYGVPQFIESGIDAIKRAVDVYNLDIRGDGSPGTIAISPANSYLFQYFRDAKKIEHILKEMGVTSVFAMNKRKNMIIPHFLDDRQKTR